MKKGARKKIKQVILSVLFLGQIFLSPMMVGASSLINWENPNKNGDNPYKINFDNILTSGLLTQVVGCTGITNKIAEVIYSGENSLKDILAELKKRKAGAKLINIIMGTTEATTGLVPTANNLPQSIERIVNVDSASNPVFDEDTSKSIQKQTESMERENLIKSCFNGIAYTLAKNQLTSIARNTLNWVNSGFSGDPVYVQNVTLALQNVERSIVEPAIEELSYGAFPWGNTFIQSRIERIANRSSYTGDTGLLSRTASDLANYIKNDFKYNSELSELDNQRIRAESAVRTFANDFSSGGWTGWLSMIINDNNNYLGYQSRASRVLQEKVEEQQKALQSELEQNDGYYNQTECVKWQRYNKDGTPMRPVDTLQYGDIINDATLYNLGQSKFGSFSLRSSGQDVFSDTKQSDYDVCVETKAVTPGSNIKTRVDTTLGIPERQLEIADDINDVLNSVFSVLLSVLQDQGLSGLSSGEYTYTNSNIGIRTFSGSVNEDSLSNHSSGDASFNLTRDLGNTFIYDTAINLGSWDANKNIIKSKEEGVCYDQTGKKIVCPTSLIKDIAPKDCLDSQDRSKKITCPANVYYVVSNPGKTKLADGSYSGWAVGDRAFWDGNSWQNWKKDQPQPIKKRGVLQLQEDYSVAAKEILAMLPKIMPMIGELDYCIPGPNPSWQIVTTETSAALFELMGAVNASYDSYGMKLEKETRYYRPDEEHQLYQNYMNFFKDLDGKITDFWNKEVIQTAKWFELNKFSEITKIKGDDEKERLDEQADLLISDVAKQTKAFNTLYKEIVDKRFGPQSSFWREFDMKENTAAVTRNPGYLPMIASGSKITSNILIYDEEISNLMETYKNEIVNSEANIYKLKQIKKEVSDIILTAQNRRANKMIEKIKEEEGLTSFTIQDFEERYKDCLDQENINYYDDLEVLYGAENNAERCGDGLDNDLDGFVDGNDMDCNSFKDNIDNFNVEDGYGSGAEVGYYRTGYNTKTTEPEEGYNKKEIENEDEREEIDMYKYNTGKCDPVRIGKCLRGEATSVQEYFDKYSWTCLPSFTMENYENEGKDNCSIYKEITETSRKEAEEEFLEKLKGG
ncbi:MAG TPA: hypothetical protein PLH90_01470, partial [Candidatus Paceibacterota bacterium]|nr:hypothetical protein [Candidatus Paceibacterota bacterium]